MMKTENRNFISNMCSNRQNLLNNLSIYFSKNETLRFKILKYVLLTAVLL